MWQFSASVVLGVDVGMKDNFPSLSLHGGGFGPCFKF